VAVAYFTAQSCLHIVINYLRQPELDQNIPYLLPYHQPVPSCGKFSEKIEILRSGQIPWLGSKFCVPQITVVPTHQWKSQVDSRTLLLIV